MQQEQQVQQQQQGFNPNTNFHQQQPGGMPTMSINTQSVSAPSTVTMAMGNMSTMGAKAATSTPQQRPPGRPAGNVS